MLCPRHHRQRPHNGCPRPRQQQQPQEAIDDSVLDLSHRLGLHLLRVQPPPYGGKVPRNRWPDAIWCVLLSKLMHFREAKILHI